MLVEYTVAGSAMYDNNIVFVTLAQCEVIGMLRSPHSGHLHPPYDVYLGITITEDTERLHD